MSADSKKLKLEDINWRLFIATRKFLLLAVALFLVAAALLLIVGYSQVQAIFAAQSQITRQTKSLADLQRKAAALQQVEVLQLVERETQINSALPSHKPLLEFLSAINQSAAATSVSLLSIDIAPGSISTESASTPPTSARTTTRQANKGYESLDLALNVEGTLASINDFLSKMETTVPLTNLTSLALNEKRSRTQPAAELFQAEITLTTYYYNQSINQAVESPLPAINQSADEFLQALQGFVFPVQLTPSDIQGGGKLDLFEVERQQLQLLLPSPTPSSNNTENSAAVNAAIVL